MTPEYLAYATSLANDLEAANMPVSARVVRALIDERDALLVACEASLEILDAPPTNCSCHLSPPCSDCVDHSGTREAIGIAKAAVAKAYDWQVQP